MELCANDGPAPDERLQARGGRPPRGAHGQRPALPPESAGAGGGRRPSLQLHPLLGPAVCVLIHRLNITWSRNIEVSGAL